jgi:hypothetical protein
MYAITTLSSTCSVKGWVDRCCRRAHCGSERSCARLRSHSPQVRKTHEPYEMLGSSVQRGVCDVLEIGGRVLIGLVGRLCEYGAVTSDGPSRKALEWLLLPHSPHASRLPTFPAQDAWLARAGAAAFQCLTPRVRTVSERWLAERLTYAQGAGVASVTSLTHPTRPSPPQFAPRTHGPRVALLQAVDCLTARTAL